MPKMYLLVSKYEILDEYAFSGILLLVSCREEYENVLANQRLRERPLWKTGP